MLHLVSESTALVFRNFLQGCYFALYKWKVASVDITIYKYLTSWF